MDYKELLRKYIEEVGTQEGTDFIPKCTGNRPEKMLPFTQEELNILWKLTGWDEEKRMYLHDI